VALPTEPPDTSELVFRQPLAAGCATAEAVYVFSDGGGTARFDGTTWALVDPTLRSLTAAVCTRDRAVAVGPAGRVVTVSDRELSLRVDTVQVDDLNGVATLTDGVIAVGARGTVLRQGSSWQPFARGITEDLFGVAAFSGTSAWVVGANGVSLRLEPDGFHPVPTGVTSTLRSISGTRVDDVVAVGDGGVALSFVGATGGAWRPIPLSTTANLHAVAKPGQFLVIVGDGGVAILISETGEHRVDLKTTCDLRAVFFRGNGEYWIVGSSAGRAGVWRVAGDRLDRWGTC